MKTIVSNFFHKPRSGFVLAAAFLIFSNLTMAQVKVSGKVVKEETGQPLPGASILIKGTTVGTLTDAEGEFSLQAEESDFLVISYLGYTVKEVFVGNKTYIQIELAEDIKYLDEVVVVGYGSQKKSVVTGAISSVKAKELESLPLSRIDQSLQGRASGVIVSANSGQPGSGATVRVRGLTSLNDDANEPLWVIDGVVVDAGALGYLNQADIESIEVLKDAASQAIYGARAAPGVILITTKKGQSGKLKVSYNGFIGFASPAKKLNLTNATEYASLKNEESQNAGGNPIYENPSEFGEGTDWQDEIFNPSALRQNHELSISGGNDVSTFYTSFGYWNEEGIVLPQISNYERISLRLNSSHKIFKWLTFGQTFGYAHQKSSGVGNTNSEYGGPLSSAINLDPITPVIITDPAVANSSPYSTQPGIMRDENGNPYGISSLVGQEMSNPHAYAMTRLGNYGCSDDFVGNFFADIQIIKGLNLKSNFGAKLAFWGDETFTPVFYLNSTTINSTNSFNRGRNQRFDYTFENTLSYKKLIKSHDFEVLLGQGAYQYNVSTFANVTKRNIPATTFDEASLNFNVPTDLVTAGGGEGAIHKVTSLFARVNYNYGGKYLLTAVFRRDGSSRFGPNNRYGFFPSASVGWVASGENFWPENKYVNFLKIRGGYGVVGSDMIGDYAYLSTLGDGRNYAFGTKGAYENGVSPNAPSNPDLKWEETSQINIGFESFVFKRISLSFDWFKKSTDDILMYPRIPGYVGAIGNPAANVGSMKNTGIEVELGYNRNFSGFDLGVSGNFSHMKNEVTFLGNDVEFLSGGNYFQASTYPITRTAVGQPINSFFGYQILGIFQNEGDIFRYVNANGDLIQPKAKPGDFIWADLDGDGEITENDRTFIGNPTPTWIFGLNINMAYKNVDLLIFGQGAAGHMIFQGLRRLDITNANFQSTALNRWNGEGTSEDYPRLVKGDPNNNFSNPSEFYLENGNYFRFKTIQLGYTLPKSLLTKIKIEKIRIYITAENLFTITKYSGYDPEIGGGTMSIDRGYYPQARSFMFGLNLTI